MEVIVNVGNNRYRALLSEPIDISITLVSGNEGPNCFWAPIFYTEPVISGNWVGDTTKGGSVNFKTIHLNPHGNGTHTECVGHIATEKVSIHNVLKNFHFIARLISVFPQKMVNGDRVITFDQIKDHDIEEEVKAIIIRTLPNDDTKKTRIYSGSNPPYLSAKAISYLVDQGIEHLLIDLPSVDREKDEGRLSGHKAFWNYPKIVDQKKTITEMIFVGNNVKDDLYLLNLQIISLDLDVSPSKPCIYKLEKIGTKR